MDELRRRGDEDARLVWGRWDAACEAKVHRFGRVVFPDCEDASELKALTEAALAAVSANLKLTTFANASRRMR
ncbi:hypothetical protein ACTNC4_09110 [Collinsella sp. HCP3S3_B8]|uniref:hypothetical protein n=1 Tax=Collinsella sp. HCP3S3_B8 TaxID=3438933 RepID=UPI003F8CC5D4